MSLDARDVRILRSIAENDSTSPERIQEETNIPKSTVHYRIKNQYLTKHPRLAVSAA